MNYPIADTHAHLYFPLFENDQAEVVKRCNDIGIKFQVQIGCDEISTLEAIDLAEKYDNFYATIGLHPSDVKTCFSLKKDYRSLRYKDYKLKANNFDELFSFFDKLANKYSEKIVGFGETGFDLYHENSEEIYKMQIDCFNRHVILSEKYNKPLIIHIRNAKKEFEEFLKLGNLKNCKGVVHCFSEDADFAKLLTQEYGLYLGIGGVATYPKSELIRNAIKETPIEFLLTETDAPFLVPNNARKNGVKRNDASFIPEIIQLIAKIKEIDEKECAEQLFLNAKKFYSLLSPVFPFSKKLSF